MYHTTNNNVLLCTVYSRHEYGELKEGRIPYNHVNAY